MKKLLLIITLAFSVLSFAQTKKGDWVVGASSTVGFHSNEFKYEYSNGEEFTNKTNQFNINVSGEYFVVNNFAVGVDVSYRNNVTKLSTYYIDFGGNSTTNKEKVKGNSISMMPLVSYYFANDSKFYPYLSGGAGFMNSTSKDYQNDDVNKFKNNAFIWKAKGGVSYFMTSSIALDLGLSYDQVKYKEKDNSQSSDNTFGVNVGLKLFL